MLDWRWHSLYAVHCYYYDLIYCNSYVLFPDRVIATIPKWTSVLLNDKNVTLVAFISSSIDGWPSPTIVWTHPDGQHINSSTERYNIDIPGEMSIINVEKKDAGTYHCTIYNGEVFSQTIEHDLRIVTGQ